MRTMTVHFTFDYDLGNPPGFGDALYIVEQAIEKHFAALVEPSGLYPKNVLVGYTHSMVKK